MSEMDYLAKNDLIENLRLTNEMINTIDSYKKDRLKKSESLALTIESTQKEYVAAVKEKYYESEGYKASQKYEELTQNIKDFREIVILLDLIIGVLFSYLFFMLGVNFLSVLFLFLILVAFVYVVYCFGVKYYLNKKRPAAIQSLECVIEEAKTSYDYQRIQHSLLANHLRDEIDEIDQQISRLEEELAKKTVLPEKYRYRSKEIIWYLENLVADNLKEALSALIEDDHRKQMKQMIENQNTEIKHLKEVSQQLVENNHRLAEQLENYQQRLNQIEDKKK